MADRQFTALPQVITRQAPHFTEANPKPTITVKYDGRVVCNCHRARTNAVLFGVNECEHTQAIEAARLVDLAPITRSAAEVH